MYMNPTASKFDVIPYIVKILLKSASGSIRRPCSLPTTIEGFIEANRTNINITRTLCFVEFNIRSAQ